MRFLFYFIHFVLFYFILFYFTLFYLCILLSSQSISCSYYEGEGILSTDGCQTVDVTDEWVDCSYVFSFNFFFLPHKNSLLISYLNILPFLLLLGVIITQTLVFYFQVVMEKSGQYGESLL